MYNDILVRDKDRQKPGSAARPLDELIAELFLRPKTGKPLEKEAQAPMPRVTEGSGSGDNAEEKQSQQLIAEFTSRLAQEYELAVQRGLPRNRAIASMLEWASAECVRSATGRKSE